MYKYLLRISIPLILLFVLLLWTPLPQRQVESKRLNAGDVDWEERIPKLLERDNLNNENMVLRRVELIVNEKGEVDNFHLQGLVKDQDHWENFDIRYSWKNSLGTYKILRHGAEDEWVTGIGYGRFLSRWKCLPLVPSLKIRSLGYGQQFYSGSAVPSYLVTDQGIEVVHAQEKKLLREVFVLQLAGAAGEISYYYLQ